ncbi:DUF3231 family protein [Litchfieldia salsa]|uniref:DUF3231 family protein n=1 Tax=Litchfieldia salsa TaxID=930152 RepID=A0A1H0WS32_9BACI|nr:DUF3231 family protein [Litchfieldia salsa]SDP93490.1 Protein of unknown function [Litchfieldia salsa]
MKLHNIELTSAEIGYLWASYMNESASIPVLTYFSRIVEDLEIKEIIDISLEKAKEHLSSVTEIYKQENYPIPFGYTMDEVNLEAPKLYSDTYMLYFVRNLGKAGIAANGMAFSMGARKDIRELYYKFLLDSTEVEDRSKEVMLSKGVFIRAPYIATPKEPSFVKKGSFLKGWFGERRTLSAEEIAHIFLNTNNAYGKALLIGFAQTVRSEELRSYFIRGIEVARSQIDTYRTLLEESTLPSPMTWDTEVNDSTIPPFSDKLMLFHICQLNAIGVGNIGGSLALSMRRDIATKYSKLIKDIGLFAEDGLNLMIKNEWFERPPQAIDREHLAKDENKYS